VLGDAGLDDVVLAEDEEEGDEAQHHELRLHLLQGRLHHGLLRPHGGAPSSGGWR
jgi:hypothetical protein